MLKIFASTLLSFIFLLSSFCVAEEGLEEPLMVPEAIEITEEMPIESAANEGNEGIPNDEIPQETSAVENTPTEEIEETSQENHEESLQEPKDNSSEETINSDENSKIDDTIQEEAQPDETEQSLAPKEEVNQPSQAVIEAQLAEEAELRELGAGEEPLAE
jgi:hypothetical protein